jgi:preprotein translocase subunit Sec63
MITQAEVLSSLLYLAVTYPVVVFIFRDESANRRKCLWAALTFAVAALAIKLGYEIYGSSLEPNFYASLEVSRHSSVLEIRQAYKKVSKKLHPDKNPSPDAEAKFQQVKTAYDVSQPR